MRAAVAMRERVARARSVAREGRGKIWKGRVNSDSIRIIRIVYKALWVISSKRIFYIWGEESDRIGKGPIGRPLFQDSHHIKRI